MIKRRRERWDSRTAFVLAAIGSAIGLGNVWRFPFVAYQNGGGAFLVPYFIALVTAGIPIMMLEFALGAKMQAGAPRAFRKLNRGFEFLGWWAILISAVIVFYYSAIMAWAWNYLYHSFDLKWQGNESDFFYQKVLQLSESPGQLGSLSLPLVIGLALTWIVVFFCLYRGAKSVGKVVLITVPLPWLLLIVLFFRGMTLPGAMDGVRYYLTPDWTALTRASTWLAAYGQIFFSLSLAFGVMITYASFLPKRSDVNNNSFITSFANCGTSFFAGFVVFSVVGFLAMTAGVEPGSITGGPGLAFVTYPTAISHLPALQVMVGIFFFLMLLTLGIDSAFSLVEAVATSFAEKLAARKLAVTGAFCVIGFLIGLLFVTRAGLLWLDIVDHYINNYAVTIVGLLECILIGWFGYLKVLKQHVNSVSEFKAGAWWDVFIIVITPVVLIVTIVLAFIEDFKAPYENYPLWSRIAGGWAVVGGIIILAILLSLTRDRKPKELPEEVSNE
jgi:NSS family neurotransmitter:Na+ symporter